MWDLNLSTPENLDFKHFCIEKKELIFSNPFASKNTVSSTPWYLIGIVDTSQLLPFMFLEYAANMLVIYGHKNLVLYIM